MSEANGSPKPAPPAITPAGSASSSEAPGGNLKDFHFVVFEYASETECWAVLRLAATGGSVEVNRWRLPMDALPMLHHSIDTFLSLFHAGLLKGVKGAAMSEEKPVPGATIKNFEVCLRCEELERRLAYYEAKCHRHEDCPEGPLKARIRELEAEVERWKKAAR